jgi:hypothetical protein
MNTWLEALKYFNKHKGGKYSVPKKGSAEYEQVMAIKKCLEQQH